MRRLQILWAMGMVLFLGSAAWGQDIEEYALIQGRITLPGGSIPDGNYPMESHLYNEPTGGVPLYEETHSSVAVSGGLFTLNLGSVTPIPDSLFKIVPLWLEMVVNSEVITPRIRLASVPRASHVRTIDGAKGGTVLGPVNVDGDLFVESPSSADPRKIKITGNPPVLEFGSPDVQNWIQTHEIGHALGMVHTYNSSDFLTSPAYGWSSKVGTDPERELMRITNGGNVGIGTTAPSAKLEVVIDSPRTKGMVIQGSAGQSANLMEIKDGSGFPILTVGTNGTMSGHFLVLDGSDADSEPDHVPTIQLIASPLQTANLMEIKNSDGNALFTIAPTAMLAITSSGSLQTPLSIQGSPGQTAPLMEIKDEAGVPLVSMLAPSGGNLVDIELRPSQTALSIQGSAGQSANLQEWRVPLPGGGMRVSVMDELGQSGIGTGTPHSPLHVNGAIATAITNTTSNLALTGDHSVILCSLVSSSITIDLPSAVGIEGRQYTVKYLPPTLPLNGVTIDPFGSQTIDGASIYVLSAANQFVTIVSDGANWWVIAK